MKQKLNKRGCTSQKGITLIALVITIIALLILAGVTINMVLGDNGIIGQAQAAKKAQAEVEKDDLEKVAVAQANINLYSKTPLKKEDIRNGFKDIAGFMPVDSFAWQTFVEPDYKILDIKTFKLGGTSENKEKNIPIPIPKGFAYLKGENISDGVYCVDSYGNTYRWKQSAHDGSSNNIIEDEAWYFGGYYVLTNKVSNNDVNIAYLNECNSCKCTEGLYACSGDGICKKCDGIKNRLICNGPCNGNFDPESYTAGQSCPNGCPGTLCEHCDMCEGTGICSLCRGTGRIAGCPICAGGGAYVKIISIK